MVKKVFGIVGLIVGVLVISTCGLLSVSGEGTVILAFAPQGMLAARTIEPTLSMDPASYNIYGEGPAGETFEQLGVVPGEIVQASLIPGHWTIFVDAFNEEGTQIGEGSATVLVVAGAVVTVTIELFPLTGGGQLILDVTWPANVLLDPEVTGVLTPLGGTGNPIAFANAADDLSANFTSPPVVSPLALPNGYYTLALSLTTMSPDGPGPVQAWGIVEAVRVIAGEISSKLYALVEDVNHGGIIIDPDLNNPVEITINGVVDPLLAGGDMTVSAAPAGEDSYAWYLDGSPLLDGDGVQLTGSTITFGGEVGLGYHWLSVIVTSGTVISSGEARFQVVREISGSSLWGQMVWGYDSWG